MIVAERTKGGFISNGDNGARVKARAVGPLWPWFLLSLVVHRRETQRLISIKRPPFAPRPFIACRTLVREVTARLKPFLRWSSSSHDYRRLSRSRWRAKINAARELSLWNSSATWGKVGVCKWTLWHFIPDDCFQWTIKNWDEEEKLSFNIFFKKSH